MSADRIPAIESVLAETEAAHGAYEATVLNGVYDEQWPQWYAAYAVDHGISDVLGRTVAVDELGQFLSATWAEFQAADPAVAESWRSFAARRLAEPA